MDRRERFGKLETSLLAAMQGLQAGIYTALPGIVSQFDAGKMTCQIKPGLLAQVRQRDGSTIQVSLPTLLDVPVAFQGGGGITLTFPVKLGDEALVVFSSRCIDAWWQLGADPDPNVVGRPQLDLRMHDLSDGFAFVGLRSLPRAFTVSTSAAQLRSDDGAAYIEINPTTHRIYAKTSGDLLAEPAGNLTATVGGNLTATVTGSAALTAPTIALTGAVTITGDLHVTHNLTIDGTTLGNGINLNTHHHTGVTTGGGNTGGPA